MNDPAQRAACSCPEPVPGWRGYAALCWRCHQFIAFSTAAMKPMLPIWRVDHSLSCVCMDCVMRRLTMERR